MNGRFALAIAVVVASLAAGSTPPNQAQQSKDRDHPASAGDEISGVVTSRFDPEGAAQVMARHQVRRLPVLNRAKRLVGVVALADLSRSEDEVAQGALKDIAEPSDKPRR